MLAILGRDMRVKNGVDLGKVLQPRFILFYGIHVACGLHQRLQPPADVVLPIEFLRAFKGNPMMFIVP